MMKAMAVVAAVTLVGCAEGRPEGGAQGHAKITAGCKAYLDRELMAPESQGVARAIGRMAALAEACGLPGSG